MLCDTCQAESDAWLDTKPSEVLPRFGIAHGSGAAYDATPAGIRDRDAARWAAWRELVVNQRRMIRAHCAAADHANTEVGH